MLRILVDHHEEYLPRLELEKLFSPDSPTQMKSPKLTKSNSKQKPPKIQSSEATIKKDDLPSGPFQKNGLTMPMFAFLEVRHCLQQVHEIC